MSPSETAKVPNYAEIMRQILSSVDGPVPTDKLAAQLLEIRPSNAKNPRQAALMKIREEEGGSLYFWTQPISCPYALPIRVRVTVFD